MERRRWMMESLAGRIYLLAYDPAKQRFTSRGELGILVRAARLTELFLAGRLRDDRGKATVAGATASGAPIGSSRADGPVLAEIEGSRPRTWAHWVGRGEKAALAEVREELTRAGLVRVEPFRWLGIFPTSRVVVLDP